MDQGNLRGVGYHIWQRGLGCVRGRTCIPLGEPLDKVDSQYDRLILHTKGYIFILT